MGKSEPEKKSSVSDARASQENETGVETLSTCKNVRLVRYPGRPSMDILVRSWQDLAKILEKS